MANEPVELTARIAELESRLALVEAKLKAQDDKARAEGDDLLYQYEPDGPLYMAG